MAPHAKVAHGQTACVVSLNDMAVRPPRILADNEVIALGNNRRVRYLNTPHVPRGWEAGVLYEERRARCCAAICSRSSATSGR